MHPEKYSLTWHTYSNHLRDMMKDMMKDDFADVTLVSEDKKHIRAHKNVLGACSPVFKDIMKLDQSANPIIYLRGIKFSELESIMQFIYLGEARFSEERMNEFLSLGRSLEIKELCNKVKTETNSDNEPSPSDPVTSTDRSREQTRRSGDLMNQPPKRKLVRGNGIYECDQCDKTYGVSSELNRHIKTKHEDVNYECNQCDKKYTSISALNKHRQSVHEGVKYACDQCDHQAAKQSTLKQHMEVVHEGVRYECEHCDYQATQPNNLKRHIESIHEGVKYACYQCDFQASQQGNLKTHTKSKHEGVKYACDQCDYRFSWPNDLTRHIKSQH